jgi:glucan 1,3-beta-glucosidase
LVSSRHLLSIGTLLLALAATGAAGQTEVAPLPPVQADGQRWVTADGEPIDLRGVNLGNWLILERWMFRFDDDQWADQAQLEAILARRFGPDAVDGLLDVHRAHWIQDRDLELARSFGFNVVRVPFHYGLLVDEAEPGGPLRDDAFEWLDRAVDLAERHGLYVILGMHSVPGGQSDAHHAWRGGVNGFWDDPDRWHAAARLWGEVAARYKDRPSVAAYGVLNEPFGVEGERAAVLLPKAMRPIVEAIREAGSDQVILLPGTAALDIDFYAVPASLGWHNVGFTLHEYPGRYGHPRSERSILDWIEFAHPHIAEQLAELDAPFLIGEHNVNFREAELDGPGLQARLFASHASRGWASTMWSLKLVRDDDGRWSSFGLLTNRDPIPRPDVRTASRDEISDYFRRVGSMAYDIDGPLRTALLDLVPATRPGTTD